MSAINDFFVEDESVKRLKNGLNLTDLISEGATFEIHPDEVNDDINNDDDEFCEEYLSHTRFFDCFEDDVNDDENLSPFEQIALKMENVDDKGYVKKRILHSGIGEKIPENAAVTIHYDGFLEDTYADGPYDTTLNKYPRTYRLGSGNLITGLEVAIASMKNREIAQFIIEPIYGFGKWGCLDRIPGDTRLMFRIEVLKFVDSITADLYEKMNITERKKFSTVRKLAEMHQNQGRDSFKKQNYKSAIRSYNSAIKILETAQLADMSEQEIQQKTLLKLYTNVAVCYNGMGKDFPKACIACQKAYNLTKDRSLKVPAKTYFHHGRALFKMFEYRQAKVFYLKAKQLEPNNREVLSELCELERKIDEEIIKEKKHAELLFGCDSNEPVKLIDIDSFSSEFVTKIQEFLRKFKDSNNLVQDLPAGLTSKEIEFIKMESEALGLEFVTYIDDDSKISTHSVLKRDNK